MAGGMVPVSYTLSPVQRKAAIRTFRLIGNGLLK